MDTSLPEFERPPVTETVLGVQFAPLDRLRAVHLGLAWQAFRDRYPRTEDHEPLPPAVEQFGGGTVGPMRIVIEPVSAAVVPRVWFLNKDGSRLIQLQRDRFIFNWRRARGDSVYPRYVETRTIFSREVETFQAFLQQEGLGTIIPTQCEVTYVNEIELSTLRGVEVESDSLSIWSPLRPREFDLPVESVAQEMMFSIPDTAGDPLGRLQIGLQPVVRSSGGQTVYLLRLTAMGRPDGDGMEGVIRFFDISHDWLVRGFAAITSPEMHHIWRRTQ